MGSDEPKDIIRVEEYNEVCKRAEKAEAEVARLIEKGESLCNWLGNALLDNAHLRTLVQEKNAALKVMLE